MDKYYTPSIEEFHVGFEVEWLHKSDWLKVHFMCMEQFGFSDVEDLVKQTRVKHLDREDIEDLGFKHSHHSTSYTNYFEKDNTEISVYSGYKKVTVKKIWAVRNEVIFKGTIKNKSELKKLLKQLGI